MKKRLAIFLAIGIVFFFSCQKEKSHETSGTPSVGTLQSDTSGDCLPKNVVGTYEAGVALVGTTNYIEVEVDITTPGAYTIYTDTVNGYYFRATGVFTSTGATTVLLKGNGTPGVSGVNNFIVHYNLQVCNVAVTVLPAGSGGPAAGTLAGAPNACTSFTLNGTYSVGTALTTSNNVQVTLNITTAGTYSITTDTVAGFWFAGAGTVLTGPQTVTLNGNGTPSSGGTKTFTVKFGTSICTFTVNVAAAGAGTLGGTPNACAPITVNGTYTAGTALTAGNNVQVQVNITTPGIVTIKTDTVDNFSFSFTGNLSASGPVTLLGSGNPTSSGTKTFTVTFGSSTCTFTVNVGGSTPGAGTLGGAGGTCTPVTINGTYTAGTMLTGTNTVQVQLNVTTPGTFSITTNTVNNYSFSFSGNVTTSGLVTLLGNGTPTASGPNMFTVTLNTTPTSTCTFTINVGAAPSNDYFPRTANSNWSYEWNDDATDSIYRVATSSSITAGGNSFTIFMGNDGSGLDSSGYYRRNGGDYFEWFDYGTWLGLDNPGWGEYIMLKDNVAQNANWKTGTFNGTVTGTPIMVRFSYTIKDKDVSKSITTSLGTVNYTNVISVEERIEVFDGTNWIDVTAQIDYYGKSYYARGIGLILFEAYDAANNRTDWMELRRHVVN